MNLLFSKLHFVACCIFDNLRHKNFNKQYFRCWKRSTKRAYEAHQRVLLITSLKQCYFLQSLIQMRCEILGAAIWKPKVGILFRGCKKQHGFRDVIRRILSCVSQTLLVQLFIFSNNENIVCWQNADSYRIVILIKLLQL